MGLLYPLAYLFLQEVYPVYAEAIYFTILLHKVCCNGQVLDNIEIRNRYTPG